MNPRSYAGLHTENRKYLLYYGDDQVVDLAELAEAKGWVLIAEPNWGAMGFAVEQTALAILCHATNNPQLANALHVFYAAHVLAMQAAEWQMARCEVQRWIVHHQPIVEALRQQRFGNCSGCG